MKLKNLVLTVAAASSLGVVQPTTVSKAKGTKEETKDKGGRSLVNAANIGGGAFALAAAGAAGYAAYRLGQQQLVSATRSDVATLEVPAKVVSSSSLRQQMDKLASDTKTVLFIDSWQGLEGNRRIIVAGSSLRRRSLRLF